MMVLSLSPLRGSLCLQTLSLPVPSNPYPDGYPFPPGSAIQSLDPVEPANEEYAVLCARRDALLHPVHVDLTRSRPPVPIPRADWVPHVHGDWGAVHHGSLVTARCE